MSDEEDKKVTWSYCPGCGTKLPDVKGLRFCVKCGLDLLYLKEHKILLPRKETIQYTQPQKSYSSGVSVSVPYKPHEHLISDENVLDTKDTKLWGNLASMGFPLLGYVIVNSIVIAIFIALIFTVPNVLANPFFIVGAVLITYVLFIIPVLFVGKYLQNPNLENRLTILGFTTKGYDRIGVLKEILIGLAFALVGLVIVVGSSIAIELILRLFGVRFVEAAEEVDVTITGWDIFVLIFMVIMMIVVVGPSEEILFRGFMQRGLVRNIGEKHGILVTAVIFALLHLVVILILAIFISPLLFIILFIYFFTPYILISLMIGVLFEWRNENLIAVTVTHGVYNSITIIISFLFYVYG